MPHREDVPPEVTLTAKGNVTRHPHHQPPIGVSAFEQTPPRHHDSQPSTCIFSFNLSSFSVVTPAPLNSVSRPDPVQHKLNEMGEFPSDVGYERAPQSVIEWFGTEIYAGDFSHGTKHGHGSFARANGDLMQGKFHRGMSHGSETASPYRPRLTCTQTRLFCCAVPVLAVPGTSHLLSSVRSVPCAESRLHVLSSQRQHLHW